MRRLVVVMNINREGPGYFETIAKELGIDVFIVHLYLGETIPNLDINDILLILGGPMGLSDLSDPNYDWLRDEINLIKLALDLNIPYLGVCLGAQLLAYTIGGNVQPLLNINTNKEEPEIGWAPIRFNKEEIIGHFYSKVKDPFYALHWHGDRIILPEECKLIASTDRCREQMFRLNKRVYGIQFHVELLERDYLTWIKEDNDFINRGLGDNGATYLKSQMKILRDSAISRKNFIRILFGSILEY